MILLVLVYHVVSRLAYVIEIGVALTGEERRQCFTRGVGAEEGFRRFRRLARVVLDNDAVSFVLLCLVTRGQLTSALSAATTVAAGVVLIVAGMGAKLWAARSLDPRAYYWHDFFAPEDARLPDPPGPYRFLANPMYTIGYLHAYGFAILCGSWLGLAAAALDQLAVLVFARVVERPHFERIFAGRAEPR